MNHDHSPEAIAQRLANPPRQSYLRDWIYGGIDGAITTFAIVSGVVGGKLSAEVRQILINKGLAGEELESLLKLITANKELWMSTMLHEEYGLPKSIRSPTKAALSTFFAFLVCGFVPLAPYILPLSNQYTWSVVLTAVVFFLIGSMKSKWSLHPWWASGTITLAIGAAAAALAYSIGFVLRFYLL